MRQLSPRQSPQRRAARTPQLDRCADGCPCSDFGLRALDTFSLALLDETTLHLREHAKYGDHDVTHLTACADMWVEHGQQRAELFAFMDEVQDVTVKACDEELVAAAKECST